MPRKSKPFDLAYLCDSYRNGKSLLALSRELGVSRSTLGRRLVTAGIPIRDGSTANRVSMQQMSAEQRLARATAAHESLRGKTQTLDTLIKRANSRGRNIGHGELELIDALRAVGINAESQFPCGKYNIDVTVGPIAVEICGPEIKRLSDPVFLERAEYLRNRGYSVILIFFKSLEQFAGNLDHLVAFLQYAQCDPTTGRKDWMIRCTSERFTRVRNNLGQFAVEPTTISFGYALREWNF